MQLEHVTAPAVEYVPATQADEHGAGLPLSPLYLPSEHNLHTDCFFLSWYLPAPQLLHTEASLPSLSMYVPVTHSVHVACPLASWCRPLVQLEHVTAPAVEYVPATHADEHGVVLPSSPLCMPPEHNLHPDCFGWSWYLPAPQLLHTEASLLSLSMNVPARHSLHVAWPVASWCRPLVQFEHVTAPAVEYVPATHDRHASIKEAEAVPSGHAVHLVPPVLTTSLLAFSTTDPALHDPHAAT